VGATAKAPRWAIAYKYAPEQAETKLNAITIQVGAPARSRPWPNSNLSSSPGSNISRATLHNEDYIREKTSASATPSSSKGRRSDSRRCERGFEKTAPARTTAIRFSQAH